jgi:hypothetical protein
MLRTGDWVVPTLYGEPLLTKPPGMYAAIALMSLPFGAVTTATARLPSALAATTALVVVAATFRRCLGGRAGLVAAGILPASLLWLGRVPSAEIDMLELAWVAAALCAALRALELHEEQGLRGRRGQWLWWHVALLCVAGGFLTKWTAPAFFYLTLIPLLLWRRRLGLLWRPPHVTAAVLASGLCLGWLAAVAHRIGWAALWHTIQREALQRLSPANHPRAYPWVEAVTFPLVFLAATLPWSACIVPTFWRRFSDLWDERGRRLLQLLQVWTWVNLLFWSLVPCHKVRHALPLQPGLVGLAVFVWVAWIRGLLPWRGARLHPAAVLGWMLAAWGVVSLVYVHVLAPRRDEVRQARAAGERIASLVPPDAMLYLFELKDEGTMFYYGRPARRLASPQDLPSAAATVYCLLTDEEWKNWSGGHVRELLRTHDQQGAAIVLVAVHRPGHHAEARKGSLCCPRTCGTMSSKAPHDLEALDERGTLVGRRWALGVARLSRRKDECAEAASVRLRLCLALAAATHPGPSPASRGARSTIRG